MPASEARGTHIFMMRHAITVWNLAGRIQGHHDAPLAPDGERQIVAWRAALEGWGLDRIYSSDLARAQTTARRLNQTRGLPLAEEPRLREQDWGEWTGRVQRRLKQEDSAAYKRQTRRGWQFRPPGGESQLEVLERALAALRDISARHPGERILVVTHEGVLKCLVYHLAIRDGCGQKPVAPAPYHLHHLTGSAGQLILKRVNVVDLNA
ncbi:MAG: histidine phosphatase family protein [Desulfobacterales bacterium]